VEGVPGKALTMGGAGLGLAHRLISTIRTGTPAASAVAPVAKPEHNGVAPL
jgi:hypothetical protein